ncbi:MAG TPA: hypothetical protein VGG72_06560 [Bryobacteraceae bacterium]|jgi:hypothetical protein
MPRLKIDGSWEPEDFIEVLKGVESLYYKVAIDHRSPYDPPFSLARPYLPISFDEYLNLSNDWLLGRALARAGARGSHRMRVARIHYASPGKIDLVGLGEACRAIEGIVDRLVKFFTERELRREAANQANIETLRKQVELEKDGESLRALKIENARSILTLRRDFHDVPQDHIVALIGNDQDRLIPRIAEQKIIGVKRYDGETPKENSE